MRTASLFLVLAAAPALAQTPRDLSGLVGARAAGAESELQRRGYVFIRTQTGDDRKWGSWWHPGRRVCLSVVTRDGRYDSIVTAPAADCGHSERGHHGGNDRDRDRSAYPDIGYRPPAAQVASPSYADRGGAMMAMETDANVELGLVCFGDGQRPGVASSSGWTWNSRTRRYDYGTRTELTQQHFDASLMLQLWQGGGRIRLPKKLIPPIHSRGDDENWWTLYAVSMDPDTITASYRLNGLNKPKLTVDRRSGRITVVGTGDYAFRGSCDVAGGSRRF
jgi:hypothetical protein